MHLAPDRHANEGDIFVCIYIYIKIILIPCYLVNQGHRSAMLEPGCPLHLPEEVPSKSKRYTFSRGSSTSENLFHLNADVNLNLFSSPSAFPPFQPCSKRIPSFPSPCSSAPSCSPGKVPILNSGPGHGYQSFFLQKTLQ